MLMFKYYRSFVMNNKQIKTSINYDHLSLQQTQNIQMHNTKISDYQAKYHEYTIQRIILKKLGKYWITSNIQSHRNPLTNMRNRYDEYKHQLEEKDTIGQLSTNDGKRPYKSQGNHNLSIELNRRQTLNISVVVFNRIFNHFKPLIKQLYRCYKSINAQIPPNYLIRNDSLSPCHKLTSKISKSKIRKQASILKRYNSILSKIMHEIVICEAIYHFLNSFSIKSSTLGQIFIF